MLLLLTNIPLVTLWSLGILNHFSVARFTLCKNVRNTPAASSNLSNYHVTLAWIVAGSHKLWHSTYKCLSLCIITWFEQGGHRTNGRGGGGGRGGNRWDSGTEQLQCASRCFPIYNVLVD